MADRRLTRRAFVAVGLGTAGAIGVAGWFGRGGQGAAAARRANEQFLHVSRLLTGVDDLPERLAPVYLEKLSRMSLPMSPSELAAMSTGASSLDELDLDRTGARECAEEIAAAWRSGMVDGEVVAYVDALVWRGLFAKPSSTCLGETGAWSKPGRLAA